MLEMTRPTEETVGAEDFRAALRLFASGVTVITAHDGVGGVHGMTATAFSSLSLRPPLVLVAVARDTRAHRLILAGGRFGVSILHEHQVAIARHFGRQGAANPEPRIVDLDGTPVVADAMATLSCTLEQMVEGGDHSIFVGLVRSAEAWPGAPLLHFDGGYRALDAGDGV